MLLEVHFMVEVFNFFSFTFIFGLHVIPKALKYEGREER